MSVPVSWPQTWQQWRALWSLCACALLLPVALHMVVTTTCNTQGGRMIEAFGQGTFLFAHLAANTLVRFLRTGDGTGFRVMAAPIVVLVCLGATGDYAQTSWSVDCSVAVALFAIVIALASLATDKPEEICSSSPLYRSPGSSE